MLIRRLTPADAGAARAVRLRALREHPEAFATSYEEERERDPAETARRLEPGPGQLTLGAFDDGRLVGTATLTRSAKPKLLHRATLAAMYVAPEARARGAGGALLEGVLETARGWGVTDVGLAVTVGNAAARRIYERAGFVAYGVEPRALRVDGRFHDVELMCLRLA